MATEIWAIGVVILATMVGASAPVLLKKASNKIKLSVRGIFFNKNLIGGLALYGVSTLMFIPALKAGDLSVLYPIVAITYVWVSILSVKMLGEKMNAAKWVGIGLILFGVAFIGLGSI